MKIEDILAAFPSREDIAAAAGLQARSSGPGDVLTTFTVFGAGVLLGAGLALLFAPKSGSEIRRDIADALGDAGKHLHPDAPGDAPST